MKVFRFFFFLCLLGFGFFFVKSFLFPKPGSSPFNAALPKEHLVLFVDNLSLNIPQTTTATVKDFLQELNIPLNEADYVWPRPDQALASGDTIILRHSRSIKLKTGADTKTIQTTSLSAPEFLAEQGISLGDNDILLPNPDTPLTDKLALQIIRVHIEEKTINQPIAFVTTTNEDDTLSWRKKITTQKGARGNKALTYKIISYDGKEIQRKLLATEITQPPTTEIVTQGTYVKVG
ncbi:MAG: G5 domain-containing protein, partial [Candidatus Moraniibacteriota bacterium]